MSQEPEQPCALIQVKNREKNRGFTAVHLMVWTVSQAAATLDRQLGLCVFVPPNSCGNLEPKAMGLGGRAVGRCSGHGGGPPQMGSVPL